MALRASCEVDTIYNFNFSLTYNDYLKFNIHHHNSMGWVKWLDRALRLSLPVVLFFMFLNMLPMLIDGLEVVVIAVLFLIIAAVWFFVFPLISRAITSLMMRVTIKSMQKGGKMPYDSEMRLRFGDDDILEVTEAAESRVKYTSIEKIRMGDTAIYIYISAMQAYIMPFSVFDSREHMGEFIAFVREKTGIRG